MNITKQRIIEIIKEEIASQASSVGGASVKKFLQQNPAIDKLAATVAKRVEKLPAQSKAIIAAAILQKMGFSDEDMERIKSIIPRLMSDETKEV